jgi:lysylphosphatidylglycerol synthetase-like protein (DUF2156 family)
MSLVVEVEKAVRLALGRRPGRQGAFENLPHDLLEHGRTAMAYSWVADPSVQAYTGATGTVLYGQVLTPFGVRTLVCGDPLCAPGAMRELLASFVRVHGHAGFFQISAGTVDALQGLGYQSTHLAVETSVPLETWTIRGRDQQNLRTARNRALREGVLILEGRCEDFGAQKLRELSRKWMRQKTLRHRELSFFARPAVYRSEPGVRKFFALQRGEPKAFVVFDPMFEAGKPFGYVANILRQDPGATPGLCDAVIVQAAQRFADEGLRQLHLGMSPFCPPRDLQTLVPGHFTSRMIVDINWKLLNPLFNYRGIAFHKRRWRANETPVFYAGKPGAAVPDFFAAARATGLL